MTDFLREIEEDIRRQRLAELWSKLGKAAVIASVTIVLVTVVYVLWQNHRASYQAEQTSLLLRGMERLQSSDYRGAVELFDTIIVDSNANYQALALLQKAQALKALGDEAGVKATLQALAALQSKNPIAGLAPVLAADASDTLIEPVKDSPFYYSQQEARAWQLLKQAKPKEAALVLQELINDRASPSSMRKRAQELLALVAPDAPATEAGHAP
ncbi:MAG: hypothetical protein SFT92_03380 [Rickettsiales bacterium]|nr:hypothetical protein [Rickettsiales bacterium]